jgi:hypothetical protein
MIENYLSRPDEELEDTAADRAALRNATFSLDETVLDCCRHGG